MTGATSSISPAIIDSLYAEALQLAEDARAAFEASAPSAPGNETRKSETRLLLSGEALRTTTRMMHALAWLLNHRAYYAGELSESQLSRHGDLPEAQPLPDRAQLALLDPRVELVAQRSHAFYARLIRLDLAWRAETELHPVMGMRARIGRSLSLR